MVSARVETILKLSTDNRWQRYYPWILIETEYSDRISCEEEAINYTFLTIIKMTWRLGWNSSEIHKHAHTHVYVMCQPQHKDHWQVQCKVFEG